MTTDKIFADFVISELSEKTSLTVVQYFNRKHACQLNKNNKESCDMFTYFSNPFR